MDHRAHLEFIRTRARSEILALVFSIIRNYAMLRYISIIINSIVTMLLAREHIYIFVYIIYI